MMSDDKIVPQPLSEDLINFIATNGQAVRESTRHAEKCPPATPPRKFFAMKLGELFAGQSKKAIFVECLLFAILVGYIDFVTPWQWTMSVFYAPPILLAVWHGPRKSGLAIAVLCGVIWYLAGMRQHPYISQHAYVWVAFNRVVYFLFVAIGGMALKTQRDEIRARMEAMTRARTLEQEIVRVSEREQMRIGQDLHDGLCQDLAAIDCATACLKSDLEGREVPEAAAAGNIQKLLQDAIIEARNLARGISPVHMDAENLPAALEDLVASANRANAATITFDMHGQITIGDTQTAIHLYRIAQEALRNAVRHSGASRVDVELNEEGDHYTLLVRDNGRGFDDSPVSPTSTNMGLGTIRYRARLLGASCEIDSKPGAGTVVRCSLPLHHASQSPLQHAV
jgi:signal transduction histidine kinase